MMELHLLSPICLDGIVLNYTIIYRDNFALPDIVPCKYELQGICTF
jgi:hypothetical protein